MHPNDLVERRAQAEEALAAARGQRASALLDGKRCSGKPVADAESEIAALDDAIAEARRRERAEQSARHAEAKRRAADQARKHDKSRLEAIKRAETALNDAALALSDVQHRSAEISKALAEAGATGRLDWDERSVNDRLGVMVAARLRPVANRQWAIGKTALAPIHGTIPETALDTESDRLNTTLKGLFDE